MKRLLIALSILSATAYTVTAQAQSSKTPSYDPDRFSEFVYDALGATPSIQFGKSKVMAETAQREESKNNVHSQDEKSSEARAIQVSESRRAAERAALSGN